MKQLVQKTLRVPAPAGMPGNGAAATRQLDVALLSVGFKCSSELLDYLSSMHPTVVHETAETVLAAVRELVGDHVRHNSYFAAFPKDVPDTEAFWAYCIADALVNPRSATNVAAQVASGAVNLLDLPRYGRYQHTYEEMLARQDEFISSAKDRVTVLHLGGVLTEESHRLYLQLAASSVPLSEDDLALLAELADLHADDEQPARIDMRENRATINAVRLRENLPLLIDAPTDVLRLVCVVSGGDVTLNTPTRLRSLRRAERRTLMAALDGVIEASPYKLGDVARYREQFKRLGERVHPHEYGQFPHAQDVFAVARRQRTAQTLAGQVETALAAGDVDEALRLLARAPGMLLRSVDRLARLGADPTRLGDAIRVAAPSTSTRVLLSLREHMSNRARPEAARIFVNQRGRAWVTVDHRAPLSDDIIVMLQTVLDDELAGRLPQGARLVVDPAVRRLAVPTSEKSKPGGFGVLPRGSVSPIAEHLRFFVHWKQRDICTDYDLSVLLLNDGFQSVGQVSFTNLRSGAIVHSGDVTEAPAGASEFIDIDLAAVNARYIVPQVNVYSGENFDKAEEAFFGFMQRDPAQHGAPFEPRTVRAKSDLSGSGRVSLPAFFYRDDAGDWQAKWTHLNLHGLPAANRVEANRASAAMLARAVFEREYLTFTYLESLWARNAESVHEWPAMPAGNAPVVFLGVEEPEGLPAGSTTITATNLHEVLSST